MNDSTSQIERERGILNVQGAAELTEFQRNYVARCKQDPEFFIFKCLKTSDQHDMDNPVKSFPMKKYLRLVLHEIINNDRIAITKSRQMLMSWLVSAFLLWDTMFYSHRMNFIQSKMELDSDNLLERCWEMWNRLPMFMKQPIATRKYCLMQFQATGSKLKAVSQNPDAIRQYCASNIFIDEVEFQDEIRRINMAIQPTIDGGGRVIFVSSVNGINFFSEEILAG